MPQGICSSSQKRSNLMDSECDMKLRTKLNFFFHLGIFLKETVVLPNDIAIVYTLTAALQFTHIALIIQVHQQTLQLKTVHWGTNCRKEGRKRLFSSFDVLQVTRELTLYSLKLHVVLGPLIIIIDRLIWLRCIPVQPNSSSHNTVHLYFTTEFS